jgi:phage gpG-like protein
MELEQSIRLIERQFRSVFLRLPLIVGNTAVNFVLDNFQRQGFLGATFQAWAKRRQGWKKDRRSGRNILIGYGRLRRSIRLTYIGSDSVKIGTDVPYAKAHNEGLRIGQIQTVKGFTRKNGSIVSEHKRRINQNIPRRQYIGDSPYLRNQINRNATAEFMKEIKAFKTSIENGTTKFLRSALR